MKQKTKLFFLLFFSASIHAQEVVSTQGESYQSSTVALDYTIGESVIFTGTDGTTTVTQGFHQSKWEYASTYSLDDDIEISVFPNPVNDHLTIEYKEFEDINYVVYDSQGKIVDDGSLNAEQTTLDAIDWATGGYTLILKNKNQVKIKSFKLVKNQ